MGPWCEHRGFNFDFSDNQTEDFLTTSELVDALSRSQADGIDFDLIAFDMC